MSFVFTERIVNIVPAHREHAKEAFDSDEQLSGTVRKLTRKSKVLQVPAIKPSSSIKPSGTNHSTHSVKESVKKNPLTVSLENTAPPLNRKTKAIRGKQSQAEKTQEQYSQSRKALRPSTLDAKVVEEEIIRSKLLAQKEKEKSLMIQKYMLEGKKKRLAQIKEDRVKKEMQRMELQNKLNALNDYRRSRLQMISNQKSVEARENGLNQDDVSDGWTKLDQTVEKVEYNLKDSSIERVSNISIDESSSTTNTESTNKHMYKTLMVNIAMIKERIEQLANQSSSESSITERVVSTSVSLNNGDASFVSNIGAIEKIDQNVREEDILDDPHISVLIQKVEKKCAPGIIDQKAEPIVNDASFSSDFLSKTDVSDLMAGSIAKKIEILDLIDTNHDAKELALGNINGNTISELYPDDSVFISDFMDSKDLADESIFLEDDFNIFLNDGSDKKREEIGVGSLANFNRKVGENELIDSSVQDCNIQSEDYDFTIFKVLAKKLLVQRNEVTKEDKLILDSWTNNTNHDTGESHKDYMNVQGELHSSRKRRISATDSTFEVYPKKSNIGDNQQLRVLDIFQKKFIAKRHSRHDAGGDATVPSMADNTADPVFNQNQIESELEVTDTVGAQSISAATVPGVKQMHIGTVDSSSSGYDSEDISDKSLKAYIDMLDSNRKLGKSKQSKLYDEPASSTSSANSSFSEKSSKGQIGSSWRKDSKKRLMDPRYRLSPNSLVEKYDAEVSLSEVIDLSLSQVDSLVQGRRIAVAQEESLHLRNSLHQRVTKYEPITTKSSKPVLLVDRGNDVAPAKDQNDNLKKYDYDTSFDSISTDTNIKELESLKNSSISDEYSIERTKSSVKIGCFAQPLMSESAKFRVLSSSDLMEKSIKEILDYKEQAKLYFQQEFVWLNMRERAIDFRYAKEQSFYQHERKRSGKKDRERERLLIENEQALEMKLVADKEDINRQRQKILDKLEDVNSRIESVLGKLSAGAILERSKQEKMPTSVTIDEDLPQEDDISAKVSNILAKSEVIASDKGKKNGFSSMSDAAKLELLQNALSSMNGIKKQNFQKKKLKKNDFVSEEIEEEICEDFEQISYAKNDSSDPFNYEDDDFEAISEISSDLKLSKASILDILMSSPITAEVLEAAEKIKKLNAENEKRKQWLAENMRKQEFRLQEESKILGRAVDDFSRIMKQTSGSNEALKSALNPVKEEKIIAPVQHSIIDSKSKDLEEVLDIISENISEPQTIDELSADEVPKTSVGSAIKSLNDEKVQSIIETKIVEDIKKPSITPDDVLVKLEIDISVIEAEYMEDFEPIDEIIEEMVQESDYNEDLMDQEIIQKIIAAQDSDEKEQASQQDPPEDAMSQVDMITDAIWASLLNEIADAINSTSMHSSGSQNLDTLSPPRNTANTKNQKDAIRLKHDSSSSDVWTLSDEVPIELINEIIMKILQISISPNQDYECPMPLKEGIMDLIIPLQASKRRREEFEVLYDLTADSLNHVFSDHLKYQENICDGTSQPYLKPKALSKDHIINKALEYSLSCWSYSHENGENLDSLLIKEVKDQEKTWKDSEKQMSINLKERITLFILEELINDTSEAIYQLYKGVF